MNRSKKLTAALLACLLTAPALAEDMVATTAPAATHAGAQRLAKIKERSHEHTAAMGSINSKLDACVQAATTPEAVKACHMQARDARKSYFSEQRAATEKRHDARGDTSTHQMPGMRMPADKPISAQ